MAKKLIVGITIPGSVGLLGGQLKHFKDLGYDTYLLTQHDDKWSLPYCENEGCKPLNVKIERNISLKQDFKTLKELIRIFKKEKPDVVNMGTPKMGLLGMIAAWWCKVPNRIYTCRGFRYEHETGTLRKILKISEKVAGKCAHKIICISPSVMNMGVRDKLFTKEKCIVINKGSSNGIDPVKFSRKKINPDDIKVLKDKYDINGKFIYGFLGRIIDRKGINELYEAFSKIYEIDKDTRLFLVGPWDDTQIKDKNLKKKIEKHPGVILTGRTDNPALYMTVMDVFCLPAWWEGFGNVVVQAANMGLPVIGSTGTGVCDAVCDGFNGINVKPGDVNKLKEIMILLKKDEELRQKLANNGPVWGQNFKPEIIWDGMDKIYKER